MDRDEDSKRNILMMKSKNTLETRAEKKMNQQEIRLEFVKRQR